MNYSNYSTGNFCIIMFIYVCFTSLKIVCPRGINLSKQGAIITDPNSNVSAL